MATNEPLHIDAGATFDAPTITFKNDDGLPFNLTGYTGWVQVRSTAGALLLSVTPTLNSSTGEIHFSFTAAQTSTLTATRYRWSLEIASASNTIRIAQGRVTVSPEVVK